MSKKAGGAKKKALGEALVCSHPSALRQYEIGVRMEAGMVLTGSEVKSLRARKADLEGAYAAVEGGELWLHNMHIGAYEQAATFKHEPKARRKLLVKSREIEKLHGQLTLRGLTLVPLKVYFKDGWAKVELGLGKGRKLGDHRQALKKKAADQETRDAMSRSRKT